MDNLLEQPGRGAFTAGNKPKESTGEASIVVDPLLAATHRRANALRSYRRAVDVFEEQFIKAQREGDETKLLGLEALAAKHGQGDF